MPETLTLHATCVAYQGHGVLIRGASGSGKSALALQLMAYGAGLVSDDRVHLTMQNGQLIASPLDAVKDMIEARFVGLLNAPSNGPQSVKLIVDLDHLETKRLPPHRTDTLLDVTLPVLYAVNSSSFPAAIVTYVRYGRRE